MADDTPTLPGTGKQQQRYTSTIALIIAVLSLAGVSYLGIVYYYEQRDLFSSDVPHTVEQLMEDGRSLQERVNQQDTQIKQLIETQAGLQAANDAITRELGRDRTDWSLAETEQLLLIANHRLRLALDIDTALAALNAADSQLKALANPKLLGIRKKIAEEIALLNALERIDIPGTTLKLAAFAKQVESLPLTTRVTANNETQGKPDNNESDKGFFTEIWQDFTGLIRIRADNRQDKVLLPPEKSYFLRENLRLQLFGAQHTLTAGNYKDYRQKLTSCNEWIKQYFDTDSSAVQQMTKQLETLASAKLDSELPDISGSLILLRKYLG